MQVIYVIMHKARNNLFSKTLKRSRPAGLFIVLPLAFVLFGFFPMPVSAQQTLGIAAVVNDEVISIYDLDIRVRLLLASSNQKDTLENRRRAGPAVLRTLIDEKLKMQEAKRLDITVTKDEIERSFALIEKQNNMPPGGLGNLLSQRGIPKSAMTDRIRADLSWIRGVSKRASLFSEISDEQIDERLAEIETSKGKPEMRVAEIFLAVDSPEQTASAGTQAARLLQHLQKGATFAGLAQNFSQSASAAVGGDLDWVKQGQLDQKLDAALNAMKPGQVSDPIRTDAGYYILLLLERRADPGLEGLSDATVSLRQVFFPVSINAEQPEISAQTAAATAAAAQAKTCQDMDVLAQKSGSPLSGNLGKIKLSKLPDAIRSAVENLEVSTPSQPVRTSDGIVVLMVCERTGADVNTLRSRIRQMMINQRNDSLARRYLRDLRRDALVDIRI